MPILLALPPEKQRPSLFGRKAKGVLGVRVSIKRRGQFRPLGIFSEPVAKKIGSSVALATLGRTIKLERTNQFVRPAPFDFEISKKTFRPKVSKGKIVPNQFVQRVGIQTRSEVSEIQAARRAAKAFSLSTKRKGRTSKKWYQ